MVAGVNTEAILKARKTINEITEVLAKHLRNKSLTRRIMMGYIYVRTSLLCR